MVSFFKHVCLPGSFAHIFIAAEGLGTSALPCTMQLETGDRRTGHAERRGNHSPDSFSYRFLTSHKKRTWCHGLRVEHWVQSISFESKHAGVYAGVILPFFPLQIIWDTMWISKHPQLPGLRLASDATSWGTKHKMNWKMNFCWPTSFQTLYFGTMPGQRQSTGRGTGIDE